MNIIETLEISIHLNLLHAKDNMSREDFELALHRIRDARQQLEEIETLLHQETINYSNIN